MNSISIKALYITCLLICLTGCWNSKELTDLGFIMGVSIDQLEEGTIELNAQVYSPAETIGGAGAAGNKPPYNNLKTVNASVFDAARDLILYFGRKIQWSHMRVILIGEEYAKEQDIGEVLDYFYRDHETRLTTYVIITKGKAADYFENKPFIERTMSQQLRTIIENGFRSTGKSKKPTLLDIALQLNMKTKTAMIPYIETKDEQQKTTYSSGVAIINKGKMVDHLTSDDVQKINMLTNEFKKGIIEFPCMDDENTLKEVIEISSIKTKTSPKFTKTPPTIHMLTKIEGVVGELRCTSLRTNKEVKKLEDHIEKKIKEDLQAMIERFQEKKVDVFDIGNKLYQQDPVLWKKWEKDWDDIFADIQFVIDVEVNVTDTGMTLGEKIMGD
jgi:spore germination protein KC